MGVRVINEGVPIEKQIAGIQKRSANLNPILKVLAADFEDWIKRDIFGKGDKKSVSPLGDPWPELAESTRAGRRTGARKAKKARAKYQPLIDTGMLRLQTGARSVNRAEHDDFLFGIVGPAAKYGVFHLTGTSKMPARPFLPVNKDATGPDFSRGTAREWWANALVTIAEYIATGSKKIVDYESYTELTKL